jgi:endonuclease/exonuclease/phosphatase family metal-dependent hydrolase
LLDKTPRSYTIIILGDVNDQLTKTLYNEVTGQPLYRKKQTELVNCYVSLHKQIVVTSTNFQQERIHKITWLSPDKNTASQIDHIIINANKKGVIEDVKSMKGHNIESDHFLVKTINKK